MAIDYRVTTVLGNDQFLFGKLVGRERLGEPFRYEFHLLSEDSEIDFDSLLGTSMTMTMELGVESTPRERYFNGIITQVSHVGVVESYAHYVMIVRPRLWLMKQAADCRIFQNKTIPDIIKEVLQEGGVLIKDRLTENYPSVEYCVQYRESNFNFVSRLMEQEGIYYYFTHTATTHEMVLADSISAHQPISGTSVLPWSRAGVATWGVEHVWEFEPARAVTSGMTVLTDYDYNNPRLNLEVRTQKLGSYDLEQGEVYDYPGKYLTTAVGQSYARVRLEALQVAQSLSQGEGNARGMAAGGLVEIAAHPRAVDNRKYLVVQSEMVIEVRKLDLDEDDDDSDGADIRRGFRSRFTVLPSDIPFRSRPTTPRPVISGLHTATVVGSAGEEIWTDELGRIKVQFHWDRLGNNDENSTCWMRVAQSWAGMGWGSSFIPRIGHEVVVQFLEGDPDRPLVTGSVYNADNTPPFSVPTQSGIRTRTSKQGTVENFNELRFEDEKDGEEIYFHAERDFTRIVENNDVLKVGFEKQNAGDQTIDIYNNRTVTLECGNDMLHIKTGNRTLQVDKGDESITIQDGKRTTVIADDDALTVERGNHKIEISAGKSTIKAAQSIELKVGSNSILIDTQGITLKATKISIQGSMQVDVKSDMAVSVDGGLKLDAKGTMATLEGQGMTTIKGGMVMIN